MGLTLTEGCLIEFCVWLKRVIIKYFSLNFTLDSCKDPELFISNPMCWCTLQIIIAQIHICRSRKVQPVNFKPLGE
jgi:hypothetical protein